ncbi:MAG TPA: hypothetical protein PLW10_26090, partial [Myxococcota bacterium]|nr:hypothetical protein [Myxococcota bacterium]
VALAEDPTIRIDAVRGQDRPADQAADGVDPATIEIGDPVRVVFAQIEDVTVPRWTGPKWA